MEVCFVGCKKKAGITYTEKDSILDYAACELKDFLGTVLDFGINNEDAGGNKEEVNFHFFIDNKIDETSFRIRGETNGGTKTVIISSYSSTGILHAVYTLLEEAGIVFDITVPIIPQKLQLDRALNLDTEVRTFLKHRGIRQHINFPMDISSCKLSEAKEYLRNLARLRFNHITFHSYSGQWYESRLPDKTLYAGGHFYGQTHEIPESGVVRDSISNNTKYFCIPEIEQYFEDTVMKSKTSIQWLNELMSFSKKMGMTVYFSIELKDEPFDNCIKICEDVVKCYPMIDCLELITQECGAWLTDPNITAAEVKEVIAGLLGDEFLKDPAVSSWITEGMRQLPVSLRELINHIKVAGELNKRWSRSGGPGISLGIYITDLNSLRILLRAVDQQAPKDMKIALLSAHGSRHVAETIRRLSLPGEEFERLLIYSWIEFDGSMYLQQNPVTGIEQLIRYCHELLNGRNLCGFAFNHWRTAENRIAIRYLSQTSIYGPIDQDIFYDKYARPLGITPSEAYGKAMKKIDAADDFVRNNLGNIGFCYEPLWLGKTGIGIMGNYSDGNLEKGKAEYEAVLDILNSCCIDDRIAAGGEYIAFVQNRVKCSIFMIEIMYILKELLPFAEKYQRDDYKTDERLMADEICDRAMVTAREYMDTYASMLPDRGCEGTLISFFHTVPKYILKLKARFGTADSGIISRKSILSDDGPPPPAI